MDLHEVGWGIDWMDVAQDRDRLWALLNCGNESLGSLTFRNRASYI
jgi:hypothetical protein